MSTNPYSQGQVQGARSRSRANVLLREWASSVWQDNYARAEWLLSMDPIPSKCSLWRRLANAEFYEITYSSAPSQAVWRRLVLLFSSFETDEVCFISKWYLPSTRVYSRSRVPPPSAVLFSSYPSLSGSLPLCFCLLSPRCHCCYQVSTNCQQ